MDALLAKDLCLQISREVGEPLFRSEKTAEIAHSDALFRHNDLVRKSLQHLRQAGEQLGHGLSHARKVAVDAGAITLIEGRERFPQERLLELTALAHLAGVLHDIRRAEKNHARQGAQAAFAYLCALDLAAPDCRLIAEAIANHEAFQSTHGIDTPEGRLLSDSLYDADKFRWGPDNFTETLWAIVAQLKIPAAAWRRHLLPGLESLEKIRETFRTPTGKRYGPDFIERGLHIGRALHQALIAEQDAGPARTPDQRDAPGTPSGQEET